MQVGHVALILGIYIFWLVEEVVDTFAHSAVMKLYAYVVFYSYKTKGVWYRPNGILVLKEQRAKWWSLIQY